MLIFLSKYSLSTLIFVLCLHKNKLDQNEVDAANINFTFRCNAFKKKKKINSMILIKDLLVWIWVLKIKREVGPNYQLREWFEGCQGESDSRATGGGGSANEVYLNWIKIQTYEFLYNVQFIFFFFFLTSSLT